MKITIYGRPNCSWCDKAKNLLNIKQVDYEYINIEDREKLLIIANKFNMKTIPIIVKGHELIGGYTDLEKYLIENP